MHEGARVAFVESLTTGVARREMHTFTLGKAFTTCIGPHSFFPLNVHAFLSTWFAKEVLASNITSATPVRQNRFVEMLFIFPLRAKFTPRRAGECKIRLQAQEHGRSHYSA